MSNRLINATSLEVLDLRAASSKVLYLYKNKIPPELGNVNADEVGEVLHAGGQAADGAQRHAFPSPSTPSTTPVTSQTSARSSTSATTMSRSPSTTLMPCAVSRARVGRGAAFIASLDRLTLWVVTIVEEEADLMPSSLLIWSRSRRASSW
jgi:hypothetical protein